MEFLNSGYLTFFSVMALIPVLFDFFLGYLLLFTIPGKSRSTFHLGIGFILIGIFNFAYFISGTFYHPDAAFHRYLTVGVIIISESHINLFLFYIYNEKKSTFARWFLIVQYLVAAAIFILFVTQTLEAQKIYHFAGSYFDFDADRISKVVAVFIILFVLISIVVMIYKVVKIKTKERWIILWLTITYLIVSIVPSVMNLLSRDGALDRGVYQVSWDLYNIIGLFLLAIVYINSTKEKTTFMVKITGISLVTILTIFQGVTFFSFQSKEDSYDEIHRSYTIHSFDTEYKSKDTEYLAEYSLKNDSFEILDWSNKKQKSIDLTKYKEQYINTLIWEKMRRLPQENFSYHLKNLMDQSYEYFGGYKSTILSFAETLKKNDNDPASRIYDHLIGMKRTILYRFNKIRKLPDENFKENLTRFLSKKQGVFESFSITLKEHAAQSRLKGRELKNVILKYLAPISSEGTRNFREHNGNHYISFMLYDEKKDGIYEAGFSYLSYRKFIHPYAKLFIYMIGIINIVVLFGYRFLFYGGLIKPLAKLQDGVKEIREGNLDVKIPVKVMDEIGFLTYNFNNMAVDMKTAKDKIDEYTHNLQEMVDERTAKLRIAVDKLEESNKELLITRDALWGEMQLAQKIQTVLLPHKPEIPEMEISAYMRPADQVGGDYYDVINVEGKSWIVIGDVSGHGVLAGLIMMMVQTAIQVTVNQNASLAPSNVLSIINKTITRNIKQLNEDKYMTITVFAAYEEGRFSFSGLHQDIMVYRSESKTVEIIETSGFWIGLQQDIKNMLHDDNFVLNKGDAMLIYTDGITEAWKAGTVQDNRNPDEDMFGDEQLMDVLLSLGSKSTDEIKTGILDALEGYECHDDITLMVVKRK